MGCWTLFIGHFVCFTNKVGYKVKKLNVTLMEKINSLFCSERMFPILMTSRLDCMFSCAAGC